MDKSDSLQMSIFLQADGPDPSSYSVFCCQVSIETENNWFKTLPIGAHMVFGAFFGTENGQNQPNFDTK